MNIKKESNSNIVTSKNLEQYEKDSTKVFALGGLEEIGKNTYCIEHNDEIIIIDAGVKFSDGTLLGIDAIIPDYSYLEENKNKVKALFITHGHEDHIGGIPYLLKKVNLSSKFVIYAPGLAAELIRDRLQEMNVTANIKVYNDDSLIKSKYFKISFFAVNHSIPDSYGISVITPNGRVVTTGDYKFDWTPLGHKADLKKISDFGKSTTLLLADSTNSEIEGYTMTETKIIKNINEIFLKSSGRILISSFASNVHRIQQIIAIANANGRKILIFGRSLERIIKIIRKLGILKIPDAAIISAEDANKYENNKLCIICTGSQGEELAALSRIANSSHRFIKIIPGDTVIFSSSPIPGNRANVELVVNKLSRLGAIVLENSPLNSLHTSGHASQEEQKLMLSFINPTYFMPMHGDFRMLKIHGETAESVGIKKENIFVLANGDQINLYKKKSNLTVKSENNENDEYEYLAWIGKRVNAEAIYIDGKDFSGQKTAVIKDRQILSRDGLIAVIISIDSQSNKLLTSPTIISRGSFYVKDAGHIIAEATRRVERAINDIFENSNQNSKPKFKEIKRVIRDKLGTYIYQVKKRNPLIIPVILNKK